MDRRTWEMLCRLETAGVLRFSGGDRGETAQAGELADRLFEQGALSVHLKRTVEGALADGSALIAASELLAHARG